MASRRVLTLVYLPDLTLMVCNALIILSFMRPVGLRTVFHPRVCPSVRLSSGFQVENRQRTVLGKLNVGEEVAPLQSEGLINF